MTKHSWKNIIVCDVNNGYSIVTDEKERIRLLRMFSEIGWARGAAFSLPDKSKPARVCDIDWKDFPW